MKCDRCWSEDDVKEFKAPSMIRSSDGPQSMEVFMCDGCRTIAPRHPVLFHRLFLRFASRKEMLRYYGTSEPSKALARWCKEMGITRAEVKTILSDESERFELLTASDIPPLQHTAPQTPFGYEVQDRRLTPAPSESSVVVSMFTRCLGGESLQDIAEWLNLKNVPTRRGRKWHRSTVRYILRNPLYAGYERRAGALRRSLNAPLVDTQTFKRTQSLLSMRCRRPDQRAVTARLDA